MTLQYIQEIYALNEKIKNPPLVSFARNKYVDNSIFSLSMILFVLITCIAYKYYKAYKTIDNQSKFLKERGLWITPMELENVVKHNNSEIDPRLTSIKTV